MWQLILKADYEFVFNDDKSLGMWNPVDETITLNLTAIAKLSSLKGKKDLENAESFKLTAKNMASDSRIINTLIAVINHEVMHEALHGAIEERINEIHEEWVKGGIEAGAFPDDIRDNKEFMEASILLYRRSNYLLLQEFAVRWTEGMPYHNIIMELTNYVTSAFANIQEELIALTMALVVNDIDEEEFKRNSHYLEKISDNLKTFMGKRVAANLNDVQNKMNYILAELDIEDMLRTRDDE